MTLLVSIPHATSPPVNHAMSVSPTNNATSPIKESPLAEPEDAAEQGAAPAAPSEEAPAQPAEASEAEEPTDSEVAKESAE